MNSLKIDVDSKRNLKQLYFGAKKIREVFKVRGIKIKSIKVFETKKGFHVYITLNKSLEVYELLLYQVLLGSDIRRETHNLYNYFFNKQRFNFMAKKKRVYNGNVIYESYEQETKKSKRILRRLVKIFMEVLE